MKFILEGKEVNVRPIHYTRAMRDARKAGRKTMTRRVLREQPLDILPMKGEKCGKEWVGRMSRGPGGGIILKCQYGVPGDYVYSHEPVEILSVGNGGTRVGLRYLDDGKDGVPVVVDLPRRIKVPGIGRWKGRTIPPEWARSFDLITDVRVERVQEITKADVIAEGIRERDGEPIEGAVCGWHEPFAELWDSINGRRPGCSWADDPFVWCVSFEVKS